MRYYTHITTSLSMSLIYGQLTDTALPTSVLVGVAVGSVLPDIDETKSYIGRRTGPISRFVKMLFGHRGITHSGLVIAFAIFGAMNTDIDFLFGLSLGVIFHIVGDFFSKGGVPLLLPLTKDRFKFPLYRTGKTSEFVIFCGSVAFLYYFFFM
ncbi:metal-dependent hydrolase [Bacillus shivajii]|uniref:metal-dependent hydrolase n=1 Tax=Bacillus shivajii TaxID=1983719 RepID=UPI001CFBB7B8|nr:metal-dependent hydrolase [Bacillus shivajii]UCZ53620.1 metal-dependent hydrolase [Bacillus shivajii]